MRALEAVREIFTTLASYIAMQRRLSRFVCGDCEKWEQCGLTPGRQCVVRLAQIERYGDRPSPRRRHEHPPRSGESYLGGFG